MLQLLPLYNVNIGTTVIKTNADNSIRLGLGGKAMLSNSLALKEWQTLEVTAFSIAYRSTLFRPCGLLKKQLKLQVYPPEDQQIP
jgi:hypothetical protein